MLHFQNLLFRLPNQNVISDIQKQRVLELFFCSDDRRLWVISETLGISESCVSKIVQDYFDKKIKFDRGNFTILHSGINNF